MLASVEVLPEAEFEAWLEGRREEQSAGTGELGKETWEGVCAKCHGLAGEGGIGPRIAGSLVLADPSRSRASSETGAAPCPRSARAGPTSRSSR